MRRAQKRDSSLLTNYSVLAIELLHMYPIYNMIFHYIFALVCTLFQARSDPINAIIYLGINKTKTDQRFQKNKKKSAAFEQVWEISMPPLICLVSIFRTKGASRHWSETPIWCFAELKVNSFSHSNIVSNSLVEWYFCFCQIQTKLIGAKNSIHFNWIHNLQVKRNQNDTKPKI